MKCLLILAIAACAYGNECEDNNGSCIQGDKCRYPQSIFPTVKCGGSDIVCCIKSERGKRAIGYGGFNGPVGFGIGLGGSFPGRY